MRSSIAVVLYTASLLAAESAAAQRSAVQRAPMLRATTRHIAPMVFVSDRGDSVPAERGTLHVRESRASRSDHGIELTFIRLKSTASRPGAPIVYLAGGPGGSAQLAAMGKRFPVFMRMREQADVILFDQRGTYGSTNLLCPASRTPDDSIPWTREVYTQAFHEWSLECTRHWEGRGVSLSAFNVVESAEDIEQLRQMLGVPRLSLWAISYGTQLAQVYLERHPTRVDRMILAGPEPLDGGIKMPSETDAQFARLDSAMRRDSAANVAIPSLAVLVDSVFRQLERRPARVVTKTPTGDSVVYTLTRFDVQFATAFGFGNSTFLRQMPGLFLAMSRGEYSAIAPLVARMRHFNTTAMTITTDCATGFDAARLSAAEREAVSSRFGMVANFPFPDICRDWPHGDLVREFGRLASTRVPTLFVAGTMDGRTPPTNANSMRSRFHSSRLLLLEGASHDDDLIISSPSIADTMLEFLRGEMAADRHVRLASWSFPVRSR